jgi:hypothetical protein
MKNTYFKPESEVVLPEVSVDYLFGNTSVEADATIEVGTDPVDPENALGNESPIWDDTQK